MADTGLIFVFPANPTRIAGAGSQVSGLVLVPGSWYTLTAKAAFRILFAPAAGAPVAVATSLFIPAGRWDFVAQPGQEKFAVIDDAGGNVEVYAMLTDGGG